MLLNLSFGVANDLLQQGDLISRKNWDNGTFLYKQTPSEFNIIPKVVKKVFLKRKIPIKFNDQINIVNPINEVKNYHPTNEDLAANDWFVYEEK